MTLPDALSRLDYDCLRCHVLQVDRAYLFAHPELTPSSEAQAKLDALCKRRAAGEPLAYIIGHKEFMSLSFMVTPDVLIPRPETEELIEWILQRFPDQPALKAIDLGTGSGCIALSLAHHRPSWQIVATDKSTAALSIAKKNAAALNGEQVQFIEASWLTGIHERFDLIISNPPYIASNDPHLQQLTHEPITALAANGNGLADIKLIAEQAWSNLNEKGCVVVEHGHDQGQAVRDIFAQHFDHVETIKDLAGLDRFCVAMR